MTSLVKWVLAFALSAACVATPAGYFATYLQANGYDTFLQIFAFIIPIILVGIIFRCLLEKF